jgi:hypothetical protein
MHTKRTSLEARGHAGRCILQLCGKLLQLNLESPNVPLNLSVCQTHRACTHTLQPTEVLREQREGGLSIGKLLRGQARTRSCVWLARTHFSSHASSALLCSCNR